MLVSAVQQRESVLGISVYPLPLQPSSQPSPSSPPLSVITECWAGLPVLYSSFSLAVLHMVAYVSMAALSSSHRLLSPLCLQVCSLCLHLYSCPANRFISTIFLDSYICINIRYLCFSFWLTSLCLTASRFMYFSSADSHLFLFMAECASFYTRVEQACVFVCMCVSKVLEQI